MIPNTEVLQRCAQTGIAHHIKRAQLRWSGHLVRMADDRIPKTVFYGELDAGHRTRGGQRKRYKYVLKATLKSCGIPHNTWEATATDRALWRSTCHSGLRDYEEKRCDALRDKRMRRKAIQPSSNIDTFVCHVCVRLCASRICLHSHNRTHDNINTDRGRDPSYRRLTPYRLKVKYLTTKSRSNGCHLGFWKLLKVDFIATKLICPSKPNRSHFHRKSLKYSTFPGYLWAT